jgi:hypothetical protein
MPKAKDLNAEGTEISRGHGYKEEERGKVNPRKKSDADDWKS